MDHPEEGGDALGYPNPAAVAGSARKVIGIAPHAFGNPFLDKSSGRRD
jgi:hypothetical protein